MRVSALDEVGNRDAPVGSRPWALWIIGQAKLRRHDLERDADSLRSLLERMRKHEAWKALGVPSFGMLCTTELQLTSDEADAVLKSKKGQTLGSVLNSHGGDRRSEKFQGDNGTLKTRRGKNSTTYLAARLRRDHPAMEFDESVRGSVRKAAIAAGIITPPTKYEIALKACRKLTKAEWQRLVNEISGK